MSELGRALLVAQYEKLRDEIHQRMDQRQQLLTYTMIGAASFFSIGLQSWASALTVLSYPTLAYFLACAWAQHDTRIGQITVYLREIENRFLPGLSWESYRRKTFKKRRWSDSVSLPARGLFVGSQLLALLIGFARFLQDPQGLAAFTFMMIMNGLTIVLTVFALEHRRGSPAGTEKQTEEAQ